MWVAARLVCLLGGALLIGAGLRPPRLELPEPVSSWEGSSTRDWAVFALALSCAVAAVFAEDMSRALQVAFAAALSLPSMFALMASRRRTPRDSSGSLQADSVVVVVVWAIWRLVVGLGSPRSADPVDTLMSLNEVAFVSGPNVNFLTEGSHTGVSSLHLIFHGIPLFSWFPSLLSLQSLQIFNVAWFGVAAMLMAKGLLRAGYAEYAPAAVAMLLFSPYVLLGPLVASPLYLGVLESAGLLALLVAIHRDASVAALLAFAALAGVGVSHPATAPTAVALLVLGALIVRKRRFPGSVVAAASLLFFAAVYPGVPGLNTLREMARSFGTGKIDWLAVEAILLGQATPQGISAALESGRAGVLDTVVGALLSPFAIPRTALRLWGDTLYEPITVMLAATALVVCLRQRAAIAVALPGLLLVALVTGFVSSYDRPSLTRTMSAPVPFVLLGVCGLAALCHSLDPCRRRIVSLLTALAVALSGVALFDGINPRLLPSSANGLAVEVLQGTRDDKTWLLTYVKYDWLRTELVAAEVAPVPLQVFEVFSTGSVEHLLARPVERFAWSPALESDFSVRGELCRLRPDSVVFDVVDRSGHSRVHIASLGRTGWTPSVPRERWSSSACSPPAAL